MNVAAPGLNAKRVRFPEAIKPVAEQSQPPALDTTMARSPHPRPLRTNPQESIGIENQWLEQQTLALMISAGLVTPIIEKYNATSCIVVTDWTNRIAGAANKGAHRSWNLQAIAYDDWIGGQVELVPETFEPAVEPNGYNRETMLEESKLPDSLIMGNVQLPSYSELFDFQVEFTPEEE